MSEEQNWLKSKDAKIIQTIFQPIKLNDPGIRIMLDKYERKICLSYVHTPLRSDLEHNSNIFATVLEQTFQLSERVVASGINQFNVEILDDTGGDPLLVIQDGILIQNTVEPKLDNFPQLETVPFFTDNVPWLNSLAKIDEIDGRSFELLTRKMLIKSNYVVDTVTNASGDYGVDVVAEKDGNKYGFQCKRFKGTVGVRAVQEIFTGVAFYQLDKGIIITNSYFSFNAIELSNKIGIELWDRTVLAKFIGPVKSDPANLANRPTEVFKPTQK